MNLDEIIETKDQLLIRLSRETVASYATCSAYSPIIVWLLKDKGFTVEQIFDAVSKEITVSAMTHIPVTTLPLHMEYSDKVVRRPSTNITSETINRKLLSDYGLRAPDSSSCRYLIDSHTRELLAKGVSLGEAVEQACDYFRYKIDEAVERQQSLEKAAQLRKRGGKFRCPRND